jgi:hypothetical protein
VQTGLFRHIGKLRIERPAGWSGLGLGCDRAGRDPLLLAEKTLGGGTERKEDEGAAVECHQDAVCESPSLWRVLCIQVKIYDQSIGVRFVSLVLGCNDELEPIAFAFLPGRFLTRGCEFLEQLRNF